MNLTTVLLAWAVAAPLATYGWTKADAYLDRRRAVIEARQDEQRKCDVRVNTIAKEINDAADKRIAEAEKAASALPPTPPDAAGIKRLCDSDPACRSKGR